MRRSLVVVIMVLAISGMAAAQDVPKIELFGGYSALVFGGRDIANVVNNAAHTLPPTISIIPNKFFDRGGAISATLNINRYLGVEVNSHYNAGNIMKTYGTINSIPTNSRIRVSDFSCLMGPRFALRKDEKVTPFVHVLAGVNRIRVKPSLVVGGVDETEHLGVPYNHENGFAVMAGGGLDLKVKKMISVRLFEADYIMAWNALATNPKTDLNLHNVNLSVGLVLHLGSK
jgi:hypothetical protein